MVVEQVVVQKATGDVYAALIDNKLCVKVGFGNWSPGEAGVQVLCCLLPLRALEH